MPYSDLHKKKKAKNYTLLAILVVLIALFFVLTIVRMSSVAGA